jgi:hypothetical protein
LGSEVENWNPSIEPSECATPELGLWTLVPTSVRKEFTDYDKYPPGAYALYYILCQAADSGIGTLDLVEMMNRWQHPEHPDGPPIGLGTITQVLDCVDALTDGGFLRRENDGLLERWTVLERGEKRVIPTRQLRGE